MDICIIHKVKARVIKIYIIHKLIIYRCTVSYHLQRQGVIMDKVSVYAWTMVCFKYAKFAECAKELCNCSVRPGTMHSHAIVQADYI